MPFDSMNDLFSQWEITLREAQEDFGRLGLQYEPSGFGFADYSSVAGDGTNDALREAMCSDHYGSWESQRTIAQTYESAPAPSVQYSEGVGAEEERITYLVKQRFSDAGNVHPNVLLVEREIIAGLNAFTERMRNLLQSVAGQADQSPRIQSIVGDLLVAHRYYIQQFQYSLQALMRSFVEQKGIFGESAAFSEVGFDFTRGGNGLEQIHDRFVLDLVTTDEEPLRLQDEFELPDSEGEAAICSMHTSDEGPYMNADDVIRTIRRHRRFQSDVIHNLLAKFEQAMQ